MLELQRIRNETKSVIERLSVKNFDAKQIVEEIIALDDRRRSLQKELDDTLANANKSAKIIGQLFKEGKRAEADLAKKESARLKTHSKALSGELDDVVKQLHSKLVELPNVPHPSVPKGNSDADNETVYEEGSLPQLDEKALPHWELATKYQIIDFKLGNKVTGAGFPFYRGQGARLQRALRHAAENNLSLPTLERIATLHKN